MVVFLFNFKPRRSGEISMSEKKIANGGEVVVMISNEETPKANTESKNSKGSSSKVFESLPHSLIPDFNSDYGLSKSAPLSYPSPETARSSPSPSPNRRPKFPTANENLTRRRSVTRSVYAKPKARFCEQPYPVDSTMYEENNGSTLQEQLAVSSPYRNLVNSSSPNNNSATVIRTVLINPITPKAPLMASPGESAEDEDEIIYNKVELSKGKRKGITKKIWIELVGLMCIVAFLVASLTVIKLQSLLVWGLEFWKWCVLVIVTFCGMLVTNWFMHIVVFLIEMNFLLRKKVLYFVHGLKKSVQVFIWLSFILLTWVLLINRGVKRSKVVSKFLNFITRTIASLLIGAFLWLLKTLLLKILASNFHVNTFFDRIQESIFHQYVLQTLSGPPLIEEAAKIGRTPSVGQFSFRSTKGKWGQKIDYIDMGKLHKMKRENVSAWTMKVLIDGVTSSGLSTISNTLDETEGDGGARLEDKQITNEMEATAAAYHIFRNVAQPSCSYIDEDDLLRFMIKEEVDLVFPLFEGAETGKFDRKALTNWVLKVYQGRKALAHSLNDTKTAVKQLNKLVTGVLVIVTVIVWLLLTGIATTKVIVFLSSQLVVVAFMFGNTCKTIFEAIIFVFVMHPFDVGDRCVVDGVQLLVEEMNILTTVFLKLDNEKIYYPNSVLATKPISNYYRSPDMFDSVEFSIDFTTPMERIGELKKKMKKYLERNPHHWHPNHGVLVKEIDNVNKIKMALYVNHTMNFQEWGEKNRRRTELVIELKKIFEELNIRCSLLPLAVHLSHLPSETEC
ncbi:Mechanosensitive ion channel protein [Quillaja saponaria]|uniref:Mechanosensitive ion channel protein n=2 Tax=Quillaja saponaria TaxID=32244 RepID=A0AAD7PTB6_QUISA|nr:Mechanosensitive ion channel protein [Quillaja saponaria]